MINRINKSPAHQPLGHLLYCYSHMLILSYQETFQYVRDGKLKVKGICQLDLPQPTWKVHSGWSTRPPAHEMSELMKASSARKAIRLAAMLATKLILAEAPALAASRMLR